MATSASFPLQAQLALLAPGAVGGVVASFLGLPLPYLIGGMMAVAAAAIHLSKRGYDVSFPRPVRNACVAVIGTMIGGTFSHQMVALLPGLWVSLLAMVVFVIIAHGVSYGIYRHLGNFDRNTAFFAAMPGGLVEAVTLGTEAGADARALSVQHFARIVIVVTLVPFGFFLWQGEIVGSSAGQSFSQRSPGLADLLIILALMAVGLLLGKKLRLPAGHLMGPMVLSALFHGFGLWDTASPVWLLNLAQLVVGTGLGAMFGGTTLAMLLHAFGFGLIAVSAMLGLTVIFAVSLATLMPLPVDTLIVSFAPGGVSEMGLIALSLGASPVFVAIHHLFRISLTAIACGFMARGLAKSSDGDG